MSQVVVINKRTGAVYCPPGPRGAGVVLEPGVNLVDLEYLQFLHATKTHKFMLSLERAGELEFPEKMPEAPAPAVTAPVELAETEDELVERIRQMFEPAELEKILQSRESALAVEGKIGQDDRVGGEVIRRLAELDRMPQDDLDKHLETLRRDASRGPSPTGGA